MNIARNILDLGVGTGVLIGVGAGAAAIGVGVAAISAPPVVVGVALGAACAVPTIILTKTTSLFVDFLQKKFDHPVPSEQHWILARTIKVFGCAASIAIGVGVAAGIACLPALGLTVISAATIIGTVALAAVIIIVARFVFGQIIHLAFNKIASHYIGRKIDTMSWNQIGPFTPEYLQDHFSLINLKGDYGTRFARICNTAKEYINNDPESFTVSKNDIREWCEITIETGSPPNGWGCEE